VAEVFTTSTSPALRCSARRKKIVWWILAGVAIMSRTASRGTPRSSGGSVAVRSSGEEKWVYGRAASIVLT
jgi:hypothetical protein